MRYSSTALLCLAISSQAYSFNFTNGTLPVQLGIFNATQGFEQDINIQDLIGNHYTVTDENDQNVLVGLGYYLNGMQRNNMSVAFGINAFYLAETNVQGDIFQEHAFNNLAYRYSVTHVPVYAGVKAAFENSSKTSALTLDVGIGPNFMTTKDYREHSIDGGITIPDNAFSGKSSTVFSAMGGFGIKVNNVLGSRPLECGYRLFYLGKGKFNGQNSQLLNTLNTGENYAQAIVCGVSLI